MSFYSEMEQMVQDVLLPDAQGGLGQGQVSLKRVTTTPGENPWGPPTETATVTYPLRAAVRTVSHKYIDETLIVAGDRQVTFAVPAVTPLLSDTLSIDGKDHAMKDLRAMPGAGTTVAYIAFIAA